MDKNMSTVATVPKEKKQKVTKMYEDQERNWIKYNIVESYYNLYHKDNPSYPEAQNKDAYCAMMSNHLDLDDLENMKSITESTLRNSELVKVRADALKLHAYICELQRKLLFDSYHQQIQALI